MRSFAYFFLVLLTACDTGSQYPESKDERAHVFYENDEFYAKHPEKAEFVSGGYTGERHQFVMRPIAATLEVPKNHLVAVTHQFQPWAKKVYDVASIVALLPNFDPRTRENSERLMKSSTLDRLSIVLGGLASDASTNQYREAAKKGALILDADLSSTDVPVYRKSIDSTGTEPFFALPDPAKFKSPLGNDIVIICPPKVSQLKNSQYPANDCSVQIALPLSYFPHAAHESFVGVAGVRLYYYFNVKYLQQWPKLHPQLLAFVQGLVKQ